MSGILGGLYYAHSGARSDHAGWQSLQSHAHKVGEMAPVFAAAFGTEEIACYIGQLHELRKYLEQFDRRLHAGPSVDHVTAGAKIAFECWGEIAIGKLMVFCSAGHHAGLANDSSAGNNRRPL